MRRVASVVAGVALLVAVAVMLLVLGMDRVEAAEATLSANPIPGMASLSGTVRAPSTFNTARVYIRNEERGILYQVFTQDGCYRAVALFPGEYQVSVSAEGLESDIQSLTLRVGDSPTLDLSLRPTESPRVELNPYSGTDRNEARRMAFFE